MNILDNAIIWNTLRNILNKIFGIYDKRMDVINDFRIGRGISVIDIGCGSGQYSKITDSEYLGIDMNPEYVSSANKVYGNKKRKFVCCKLQELNINKKFDVCLLVDLIHHISDDDCVNLFTEISRISNYVVICDPVIPSKWNLVARTLIALDRGDFVRKKNQLLDLVQKKTEIVKIKDLRLLGGDSVVILCKFFN